jgi:hypothetical protein
MDSGLRRNDTVILALVKPNLVTRYLSGFVK